MSFVEDEPCYPAGVALFQRGAWFEAHEVLEAAWRRQPPGERRRFLQGLIQLAVSLEHWRRGAPIAAWGQWQKGAQKLAGLPPVYEGLEVEALARAFAAFYVRGGPPPIPRWASDLALGDRAGG